jgi:hypothetical protein
MGLVLRNIMGDFLGVADRAMVWDRGPFLVVLQEPGAAR